jgi:hypothetical protein
MGKYRGGPKPWEKDDPKGRRLDPGQYPEMNAVFYTADPAEFIKMRIESLSPLAGSDEQLGLLFAVDRMIGAAQFGSMPPPTPDARERYIRMEAVMIANHASEALLRLFFAHVEHPECPWLGMSASTDFGEYKAKVAAALKSGFDREQIAKVFLGGVSRVDACIQLSDAEFEDAIDGLEMLLADCANRVLGDSFVYNAVKHGVSAVAVDDDEAKVAWQPLTGEPVILREGPVHVYLPPRRSQGRSALVAHHGGLESRTGAIGLGAHHQGARFVLGRRPPPLPRRKRDHQLRQQGGYRDGRVRDHHAGDEPPQARDP